MQPLPDWQLMGQLAKLNETAGGVLLSPDQSSDLISRLLERRRQATETAIESFQLGDTTLDSWLIFLGIAGLLVLQWGLRKRWGVP
jgi:glycerol kinase